MWEGEIQKFRLSDLWVFQVYVFELWEDDLEQLRIIGMFFI